MRWPLFRSVARFRTSACRLGSQQRNFLAQFCEGFAQFQHGLVLFDDVSLEMRIALFQSGQSFRVAHRGIARNIPRDAKLIFNFFPTFATVAR